VNSVKLSQRQLWLRDPFIAKQRSDLVTLYHLARRDSPAIARLLFGRVERAARDLRQAIWGGSSSDGGLQALMRDDTEPSRAGER
jgi:hypothetical protein